MRGIAAKLLVGYLLGLLLVGLPGAVSATKFAGEWMSPGGGARALGMGGAFTAVADDASAVYWNPAGLSGFEKRSALFMHAEQFGDLINYNFASYVAPSTMFVSADRQAGFGLALIHMGIDDIIITDDLEYEENNGIPGFQPEDGDRLQYNVDALPKEANNDFALFASYALNSSLGRLGGTLKLIYSSSVAGNSATGIGLDIGYLYRDLFVDRLNVGIKLQDITGTYISWSTGTNEFIVPSVRLGTAYRIDSTELKGSLLLSADGNFYFDNRRDADQYWIDSASADLRLGAEIAFQQKVMVRGGFDAGNPTAGAGFRVGAFGFDYAYLHHDDFESSHRISAQVEF